MAGPTNPVGIGVAGGVAPLHRQRAAALDPDSDSFVKWMEWTSRAAPHQTDRVAEAWRKARPRDLARHLLGLEIVQLQRDLADFPAVGFLGRVAREQNHEPLERVDLHAANPRLGRPAAERERIRTVASLRIPSEQTMIKTIRGITI